MSWAEAVASGMDQIRADHGMVEAVKESERWAESRLGFGVSFKQGYRQAWWDAYAHLLNTQLHMDDLTDVEMLAELGKGEGSIYWPLLHADPHFWTDCVGCNRPRLFDVRGICDDCGWEIR